MEELSLVKTLIEKLLNEKGYYLYSFNYKNNVLEIVIDRDEPISLDNITDISNDISLLLDKHEFCESSYTLDVSSLGVEKPIKIECLEKYVDCYINIHLSNPYKGLNIIEGTLKEVDEKNITIVYKNKTRDVKCLIPRCDIDKARLAIKF